MIYSSFLRGPLIAITGIIVAIIGANLFDMSYQSVEPLLKENSVLISNKGIFPNQVINYTLQSNQLKEHNIIIVHVYPSIGIVKLEGAEPSGMIFEKESKDGYLYHVIQRDNQGGAYLIKITNIGTRDVKIDMIMGEDPFLGKNCGTYGMKCNIVQLSMGFVAIGIIASIVGFVISALDFRKRQSLKKQG